MRKAGASVTMLPPFGSAAFSRPCFFRPGIRLSNKLQPRNFRHIRFYHLFYGGFHCFLCRRCLRAFQAELHDIFRRECNEFDGKSPFAGKRIDLRDQVFHSFFQSDSSLPSIIASVYSFCPWRARGGGSAFAPIISGPAGRRRSCAVQAFCRRQNLGGLRPQARFGAQPPQRGGTWRGDG